MVANYLIPIIYLQVDQCLCGYVSLRYNPSDTIVNASKIALRPYYYLHVKMLKNMLYFYSYVYVSHVNMLLFITKCLFYPALFCSTSLDLCVTNAH